MIQTHMKLATAWRENREEGKKEKRERHEKDKNICFMFTVRRSLRRETGLSRGYKESHSYLMDRRSVGFLSGKTRLAVELYIFKKEKKKEKKENTENMRAYTCIIQSTQLGVSAWSD